MFDSLVAAPAFSLRQSEKDALLLNGINELTKFHMEHCPPYRRIIEALWGGAASAARLDEVPYLPVSIFKQLDLVSTSDKTLVLHSSGTTGQLPSRIHIDAETSARQSRGLVQTLAPILGEKRIPLLIIDTKRVISDPTMLTARGAGILGLMKFGAKATFALDDDLNIDIGRVRSFVETYGGTDFMIFGFTFLVWSKLYAAFARGGIDLSRGILIHSGGWKRMEADRVSNVEFRSRLKDRFGLNRIYNFYGMVEQVGSVFLEGEDGALYPPNFTDIIVRNERTWEPMGPGQIGILQVVSVLPRSYPGHSLLTEDRGEIVSIDAGIGGRMGKAIRVHGRFPRAELRGCSDVVAAAA